MSRAILKALKRFTNNDCYFMEVAGDRIILNRNYDGVMILDSNLKVVKEITLFKDMAIDQSFLLDRGIVLHCYEKHCLVYIDLRSCACKIIPLEEGLNELCFLRLYEWHDDELLLTAENGTVLIRVDLKNGFAQREDATDCHGSRLRNDWNQIKDFAIHKVYPGKSEAIVERDQVIQLLNYERKTKRVLEIEPFEIAPYFYYDVDVAGDCILQVSEQKIQVWRRKEQLAFAPKAPKERFFGAKWFVDGGAVYLLLLSGSCSDDMAGAVEKYEILQEN